MNKNFFYYHLKYKGKTYSFNDEITPQDIPSLLIKREGSYNPKKIKESNHE